MEKEEIPNPAIGVVFVILTSFWAIAFYSTFGWGIFLFPLFAIAITTVNIVLLLKKSKST